jgi:hypothetical protein
MTANAHRMVSPRAFAVAELTGYLRSTAAALLALAAVFLAWRRLAGALGTPLGPFQLLVAAGLLAGLTRFARGPAPTGRPGAAGLPVSLAMLAIAASFSLSGGNSFALLVFWAVIAGEECWAWRGLAPARRAPKAKLPTVPPPAGDTLEDTGPSEPATDVLQQLTLRATAEGAQELSGWLRIKLAAGQRTGSLHVAFCPSFDCSPQVQAEAVSGPDCRVKASQVLPYGARLDVKLDEPAEEGESVLVWFFARSGA